MDNYKNFVQRLPNKELELLLIAIFEDKVRRKKLKLEVDGKKKDLYERIVKCIN